MTIYAQYPAPLAARHAAVLDRLSSGFGLGALAVVLSVAAGAVVAVSDASVGVQYSCAVVALTVVVFFTVWVDHRRTGDIMSVLAITGLFYLLAFGAGSVLVWYNASFGVPVRVHQPFSHHGLMRAQWLCLATWIAFASGYRVRLLRPLGVPRLQLRGHSPACVHRGLPMLYLVGWAARIVGINRGLYFHNLPATSIVGTVPVSSTTSQVISTLGYLPLVAVAFLGARAHHDRRLRRHYRVLLAVELSFAVASGGRSNVIAVVLLALGVSYYAAHRFPLRATAVAAVFALFFVFPVLYLYRSNSRSSGYQASNFSQGVSTYTSSGIGGAFLFGLGTTLHRFADIVAPAALEDRGRGVYPTAVGGTLPLVVLNFVPHAIDPGKPIVDTVQNDFTYALRVTTIRNSYFAPTQVGEMYLDFGTAGAVLAFVVLGSIYRELNDWLLLRTQDSLVCALYVSVAYLIMQTQEAFLADQLAGLIRTLLVLVVIIKCTSWVYAGETRASRLAISRVRARAVAKSELRGRSGVRPRVTRKSDASEGAAQVGGALATVGRRGRSGHPTHDGRTRRGDPPNYQHGI